MTDEPPGDQTGSPKQAGSRGDLPRLRVVGAESYADWDEIYVDNVVRVYRLLYSKVGNKPDAEDLTTEVFMAALGPLRVTASRGEVRAYLFATARTVLAGYWRRRLGLEITRIASELGDRELDDPPSLSQAPARARAALATLPDRHRRILELRFLESRSIRESAREMGISVANAKVLQHRALRMAAKAAPGGQP
jgi:RNA polymerase sigma factor (sigma-70 family)